MKKKFLLMLAMVAVVACLFAISVSAATEVDGLWYNLDTAKGTAALTYDNAEKCTIVNVVIPETITVDAKHTDDAKLYGTYTVTTLNNGTFGGSGAGNFWGGNDTVESVVIPNTVTSIGAHAFRECRSLKSVTLSSQVTALYDAAFYNCTGLTSFNVNGAKISHFDAYVFSGCSSLVELDLGECQITSIASNLFYNCSRLETINGINWNNIQSYGVSCFQYCGKISFPISPVATYFGSSAFWGCSSLTGDVILSSETTYLGDHAFRLTGITGIVIRMSDNSTQTSFNNANFYQCTRLKYVIVPDNITTFGGHAFYGCSSLEYIVVGNLTSINSGTALAGCNSLKAIITTASAEEASASWTGKYSITEGSFAPFADFTYGILPSQRTVFYGATTCSACGGIIETQESFKFVDLITDMKVSKACIHCGVETVTDNYGSVIVDLGYSVFENNGYCSILQSFMINDSAVVEFNKRFADAQITSFGVLAASATNIVDGKAFDAEGNAYDKVVTHDDFEHNYIIIKVTNMPLDGKLANGTAFVDAKLYMSAYVTVGEEIYYVSEGHAGTVLGEAVSYNDKKTDEE